MGDARTETLSRVAAEDDAAVAKLDELIAEVRRRRAEVVADGGDPAAFDDTEREFQAHRASRVASAAAFRREARGEPCPMTWACDRLTLPP